MKPTAVANDVYWVGAVDWNVRNFHGHTYTTSRGTTYNAYLVVDKKIALVDTVHRSFSDEMIDRIREVVDPARIEYVVVNHVEPDHSGALPHLLQLCPKAVVIGTAQCRQGLLKHYYAAWDFLTVKTGDSVSLGDRTLSFIAAPMIHWPDSMFTYCPQEKLLLPNDAFGQHLASSERFADEVDPCALWDEAKKYYANILWPLGGVITRKIEEVLAMGLPIDAIAPSHGLIWRRDPLEIVRKYQLWARQQTSAEAVIVYETMWGSTASMATAIARGLVDAGVGVKVFDIAQSDRTEVITAMLQARGFLFGSSTHDNDMLPAIAGFLELVKGCKPQNRVAGVFGSYGWAGGAVKEIETLLAEAGIRPALPSCSVQFVPSQDELRRCYAFGEDFARAIQP